MEWSRIAAKDFSVRVHREAVHELRQLQGPQGSYEPSQSIPDDLSCVRIFLDLEKDSLIRLVEAAWKVIQCLSHLHRGHASLEDAKLTLNPSKPGEQQSRSCRIVMEYDGTYMPSAFSRKIKHISFFKLAPTIRRRR